MKDTTIWQAYRSQVYESLTRGADALFNLADALMAESQAKSLAELSLSPFVFVNDIGDQFLMKKGTDLP